MKVIKPLKQFIITGLVLASTSIFSQSDAMMDTVCAGATEYYKVLKTEGSTYEWEISSGGKALYGVDIKSDSIRIEWTTTDVFTEEFVKVIETNKYGRSGDPVQLNIIRYPVPTAIISGSDTLFDGNTGTNKIYVALTGTSPWSIVYNDGSNDIDIKGIETSPFTIETRSLSNPPEIHKFTLVSIKNESGCVGEVSGAAEITVSPPILTSKIFHN